jgi:hypothetical protein
VRINELRSIVADEELDVCLCVASDPSGSLDRGMNAGGGIDDDEDAL